MNKRERYLESCLGALLMAGVGWLVLTLVGPRLHPVQREAVSHDAWPAAERMLAPTIDEQVRAGAPCWTAREYQTLYGPKAGLATRADIELVFGRGHEPTLAEYREAFGEPRLIPGCRPSGDLWTADLHDRPHMTHTLADDLAEVARLMRARRER